MTNEKLFDLVEELIEMVKVARLEATDLNVPLGWEKSVVLHIGEKQYVNPKIVPFQLQCEIIQLCNFVRAHKELTEDDLHQILITNKFYLGELLKVQKKVGNLIQEIYCKNEEKHVPLLYANILITEHMKKRKGSLLDC